MLNSVAARSTYVWSSVSRSSSMLTTAAFIWLGESIAFFVEHVFQFPWVAPGFVFCILDHQNKGLQPYELRELAVEELSAEVSSSAAG